MQIYGINVANKGFSKEIYKMYETLIRCGIHSIQHGYARTCCGLRRRHIRLGKNKGL